MQRFLRLYMESYPSFEKVSQIDRHFLWFIWYATVTNIFTPSQCQMMLFLCKFPFTSWQSLHRPLPPPLPFQLGAGYAPSPPSYFTFSLDCASAMMLILGPSFLIFEIIDMQVFMEIGKSDCMRSLDILKRTLEKQCDLRARRSPAKVNLIKFSPQRLW